MIGIFLLFLFSKFYLKGGYINYHRKVFMSVFLRSVIFWVLFCSICLFVQSYNSLYSFTHKQIDLKNSFTICQS